ncbi:HEAT repeat domain-containing protein [Actinoplanes sp. Pm04-4]|uniref:HEAT repeat domain-containing protein n=1 Tax=Paractinoplanes pyxinae TaxID=2997416 RepID=A0ABT4AY01_9ACTN|nr:HEAT repeat domain-containing protein [Actinoplanes pyxinae]MCY1139118.1 HEAT repeat domain-containing protein [Actinoplanes pyxinae]
MPDRLDDVFHASHRLPPDAASRLSADDLSRLRALATEPGRQRVPAMNALVVAGDPGVVDLLAVTLRDSGADPAVRAAWAMQLAATGRPDAEDALVRALPEAGPAVVRARIAAALARIGSPFVLDDLARLAGDPDPAVGRVGAFARHVVAYRHGMPGFEVPRPDDQDLLEVDDDHAPPMAVGRAGPEESAATLVSLRNDTFGLALSEDTGLRIDCGVRRMVFLYSQDFLRRGAGGPLRLPMMPGLIAQRGPDGSYATRLVLLAGPQDGESFHLALYRTDGYQMMAGAATIDGEGAVFELRGVGGVRNKLPALLRGRIQGGEFVLTSAAEARAVPEASHPTPDSL